MRTQPTRRGVKSHQAGCTGKHRHRQRIQTVAYAKSMRAVRLHHRQAPEEAPGAGGRGKAEMCGEKREKGWMRMKMADKRDRSHPGPTPGQVVYLNSIASRPERQALFISDEENLNAKTRRECPQSSQKAQIQNPHAMTQRGSCGCSSHLASLREIGLSPSVPSVNSVGTSGIARAIRDAINPQFSGAPRSLPAGRRCACG